MLVEAALVVSIHAFRGEGDLSRCQRRALFQGFNPRLPGGRRPPLSIPLASILLNVSIHAFRGEGDTMRFCNMVRGALFQSTPSGGKATKTAERSEALASVSIHAFRGEGDTMRFCNMVRGALFQSTPSGGKATCCGGLGG